MTTVAVIVVAVALLATLAESGDKVKGLSRFGLVEQKPIFFAGESRSNNREVGATCRFSSQCSSGCCVKAKSSRTRTCLRKARKSESCSEDQLKGGAFLNHCPCEKGDGHCQSGKCLA